MDLGFSSIIGLDVGTSHRSMDEILASATGKMESVPQIPLLSRLASIFDPEIEYQRRISVQNLYKRFRSHCLAQKSGMEVPNFIFEKWVFTRMHVEDIDGGNDISKAKGRQSDPILPFGEFENLKDAEFVSEMEAHLDIDRKKAVQLTKDLLDFSNQLIHRLHTTSRNQGVASIQCKKVKSHGGDMVLLSKGKKVSVKIRQIHYDSLERRFKQFIKQTDLTMDHFHQCLYVLLERYMALPGSGFQAACFDTVFDCLSSLLGLTVECFASPINAHCESFCSAFYDIDKVFGSIGSFFNFSSVSGSFQANPPFVPAIVSSMAIHMNNLLANSSEPLSFIIVLPDWGRESRSVFERKAFETIQGSRFNRRKMLLMQDLHGYYEGAQHRREALIKVSTCQSILFALQNEEGAKKYALTDELCISIKKSFRMPSTEKSESNKKLRIV